MITLVSGGQTGADQGGLFAGAAVGLETGGWAPKGWRTDAGPAPWLADFGLRESRYAAYRVRTLANVKIADALIWVGHPNSPGGILTLGEADRLQKPKTLIPFPEIWRPDHTRSYLMAWLEYITRHHLHRYVLIAGNRERMNPGIKDFTRKVLVSCLAS